MGNSLRDQLLKAGLVNEKQVKKLKQDSRKKAKRQGRIKTEIVDQHKLQAQQALTEKADRDRRLNRERGKEAERKAIVAQIRQLIETNRLSTADGPLPYHFTDKNKIKRIFVSEAMQRQLSLGQLAIVKLEEQYALVPSAIAEKIRIRDAGCVIPCNDAQKDNDADDPYADYQVPDDLMW